MKLRRHRHEMQRMLAAARGACPEIETLTAFADNRLDGPEQARLGQHIDLCATCRLLIDRLREAAPVADEVTLRRIERALDHRPAPWRVPRTPLWTAAAAVAAVFVAVLVLPRPDSVAPTPVLRGAALSLAEPLGEVTAIERFRWQASPLWTRFRIDVETPAGHWHGESAQASLAPPAELAALLAAGRTLRWRVVALDDEGRVLAQSDWASVEQR